MNTPDFIVVFSVTLCWLFAGVLLFDLAENSQRRDPRSDPLPLATALCLVSALVVLVRLMQLF